MCGPEVLPETEPVLWPRRLAVACPRGSPHFSSKAVHEFVVVFYFHFNFHSRFAADPIMRSLVSRDEVSTLMTRLVTSEKRSLFCVVNNVEYEGTVWKTLIQIGD